MSGKDSFGRSVDRDAASDPFCINISYDCAFETGCWCVFKIQIFIISVH